MMQEHTKGYMQKHVRHAFFLMSSLFLSSVGWCSAAQELEIPQEISQLPSRKSDESLARINELASFLKVSIPKDGGRDFDSQYARRQIRAVLNCAYNFGRTSVSDEADRLGTQCGFHLGELTILGRFPDEIALVWKIQKCFEGIRAIDSDNVFSESALDVFTSTDGSRIRKDTPFEFLIQVLNWIKLEEGPEGLAFQALLQIKERTLTALNQSESELSCNFAQFGKLDKVQNFLRHRIDLVDEALGAEKVEAA